MGKLSATEMEKDAETNGIWLSFMDVIAKALRKP